MLKRLVQSDLEAALRRQPAVALLGPRQVGKTTLAHQISASRPSVYLDLESPADRAKLADPELFFRSFADRMVILDEIHRAPNLFQPLRGVIDAGRRADAPNGRFLLLGSASLDLLRQSGESLAGRIAYVDMTPLLALETEGADGLDRLWLRGGFPASFLAPNDQDSFLIRQDFIRTYLERDVPQFGPRIAAETLRRLWVMLAHSQGAPLNASRLASSLAVSSPTVSAYVDLLCDLLLVRRLAPYLANVGKRMMKAPRVYVRDCGLVHALLGLSRLEDLLGHPAAGPSWEGFVVENLLAAAPQGATAGYYRTSGGGEIDLVLQLPGRDRPWAIEIKRSLAPKLERGFHEGFADLGAAQGFVVYPGAQRYPIAPGVEAISLTELMGLIRSPA